MLVPALKKKKKKFLCVEQIKVRTPLWKLFLYCAVQEVINGLLGFTFTHSDTIGNVPWAPAISDHCVKIHSEGYAIKS